MERRQLFSSNILGKLSKRILFLDESGFNLHTSNNYGYSPVAENAVLYQPASRGRNVSMRGIISNSGVEHYKLIDGGNNREIFATFLSKCSQKGLFNNNVVLVLDNVRFHHCAKIKTFLESLDVEIMYLPAYSPELNPIEKVFSCIEQRLDRIRPRATTIAQLKQNVTEVMENLGSFTEYYRHFWQKMNEIVNISLIC